MSRIGLMLEGFGATRCRIWLGGSLATPLLRNALSPVFAHPSVRNLPNLSDAVQSEVGHLALSSFFKALP